VVLNLRSRPKSGSRAVSRRVTRGFYGELDSYEKDKNLISKFKRIITSFHLEANDLFNQQVYELFKYRFVLCMFCVFNIVPKNIEFDK
jgi:hypothetical protein